MLPEFDKNWASMGFTDKELKALQLELTLEPDKGDLMKGTGGLRKMRFGFDNKGKSGSARVCYVDFAVYERIYLITAYPKNEKENLSKEERNQIKKLIKILEDNIFLLIKLSSLINVSINLSSYPNFLNILLKSIDFFALPCSISFIASSISIS